MHLSDNGENCKTSLIYFVNKLQEENFIFESEGKKYNDKIIFKLIVVLIVIRCKINLPEFLHIFIL